LSTGEELGFECRARDCENGLRRKEEEGLAMINIDQLIPIEKRITLFGKGSAWGERKKLGEISTGSSIAR
jgi:hypothetical protein